MGLFMALSAAVGAKAEDVERVVGEYVKGEGGVFEPIDAVTPEDEQWGAAWEEGGNATFLYPTWFCHWDEASAYLSKELGVPVFSLHIEDGDFWNLTLFEKGEEVAWFDPMPGYVTEDTAESRAKWAGDPDAVAARLSGVSLDALAPYFVEWDEAVMSAYPGRKAFPDDEFPIGDCWQLLDFMRRAGLAYPLKDDGTPKGRAWRVVLEARRSSGRKTALPDLPKGAKRPWWKFW